MKEKYAGTPVTATEPVFGYMADALGLRMPNIRFQLAVMNGTEPSPADIAAFEQDHKSRTVKLLLCNTQTSDALTRRMRAIAEEAGVAVVGVSETRITRSGRARNSPRSIARSRARLHVHLQAGRAASQYALIRCEAL